LSKDSLLNRFLSRIGSIIEAKQEQHELPVQQRINIVVFYAIVLISVLILPYHIITDLKDGALLAVLIQSLYLMLLLCGFIGFLITRLVRFPRIFQTLALILLAGWLIFDGGGNYGISLLFFITSFSLLYFVMGFRGGMTFAILFLAGVIVRLLLGGFQAPNIYADSELRFRMMQVFLAGGILGIVALYYQHFLVNHLIKLAYYDELTGLPTRLRMSEYIDQNIRNQLPFHLVAIKLYNFGQLASHQGIHTGDQVLALAGARFASMIPDETMHARWSGTVMLVCHEGFDPLSIRDWARDLLDLIQEPMEIGDSKVALRAGVAITSYPEDGQNRDRLLANLLSTLERPELMIGKLRFFNELAWQAEQRRFELSNAMKGAIERQEFSLCYHPKLDFITGQCSGAEILLRWTHPKLGVVSPAEFIPVAEATGMIRDITRFVFDRFFIEQLQLHELTEQLHPGYAHAINISPLDLYSLDLPGFIKTHLISCQVKPSSLELEITEGATMNDDPQIGLVLQELKFIGCSLAIDDFGTGYSSLSYLHKLNANNLKIDQSFIRTLGPGKEIDPVVDAIILMAHSLNMKVTAEGVENEYQAKYLRDKGCDYAQGFLYSQPLNLSDYKVWLKSCTCRC